VLDGRATLRGIVRLAEARASSLGLGEESGILLSRRERRVLESKLRARSKTEDEEHPLHDEIS
jgi:hypothetical protein